MPVTVTDEDEWLNSQGADYSPTDRIDS